MIAAVLDPDPSRPAVAAADWPDPRPAPGWVLVRVERAALNRLDEMTVAERGDLPGPTVIGSDGAGVVVEVGPGVQGVHAGDEVVLSPSLRWGPDETAPGQDYEILGYPTQGTHAELVVVPAENALPKPGHLTWDEAAALPLAGVTAWRALVSRGRLRPGETVVVGASSSGVGSLAVQIAVSMGAQVIAIGSSPAKLAAAQALGAARGVLRPGEDFAGRLREATGGRADLALDPTGALWQPMIEALRPGGRLVAVGKVATASATVRVPTVYWKQVDILGSSMGSPADLAALLDNVGRSGWRPVVDSVFPLSEVAAGYARLDHPDRFGKVVLAPAG